MKILSRMYPWTRKSLLNFGRNPDTESVSGYGCGLRIRILFGERMRSLTGPLVVVVVVVVVVNKVTYFLLSRLRRREIIQAK